MNEKITCDQFKQILDYLSVECDNLTRQNNKLKKIKFPEKAYAYFIEKNNYYEINGLFYILRLLNERVYGMFDFPANAYFTEEEIQAKDKDKKVSSLKRQIQENQDNLEKLKAQLQDLEKQLFTEGGKE